MSIRSWSIQSWTKQKWLTATGVAACSLIAVQSSATTAPPSGTLEATYYAHSIPANDIIKKIIDDCAVVPNRDANLNPKGGTTTYSCTLYYPELASGVRYPVVTWANGTDALPDQYDYLLRHLAGWGFFVIAVNHKNTGVGESTWMAAQYLLDANDNVSSRYYQKVDTNNVGAFGHSQGAMGAIGALLWSQLVAGGDTRPDGKKIKTAVSVALPAQNLGCSPACTTATLPAGSSILLLTGANDTGISPSTSPTDSNPSLGLNSIAAYYNAVPAGVTKAKATAKDPTSALSPGHNDIQGKPQCQQVNAYCRNGVYRYLGYPTAWLMWQLKGDMTARSIFVKPGGELFTNTSLLQYTDSNIQ